MERKELIEEIKKLAKEYYKDYSFSWDEESLDNYVYLKNLNTEKLSVEELQKIVDDYSFNL